jgi:hypothetical protein
MDGDLPIRALHVDDDRDGERITAPRMSRSTSDPSALSWNVVHVCTTACGMRATMPAKMMSEMPLPMPFSVMRSPSHMMNAVPAVSVTMVRKTKLQPLTSSGTTLSLAALSVSSQRAMP